MALLAALLPLYALVYDAPEIVAPGLVLIVTVLPANVLQTPLWIHYRNMDFLRQRLLQAIDPVVGFAVAVALAAAGAGYWSLVAGVIAGGWASGVAAVLSSPYPLRWHYDREAARRYFAFSWPLFAAAAASMVVAQSAVLAAQLDLGIAAVGAMTLASSITAFTRRVDALITDTLYPAICAVRDRLSLLEESFVKSNRLALVWAVPFGCAIALFCSDLVTFVIGERWRPAVVLLQVTGVNGALGHVAFNWDAYMRATGRTRPIAAANVVSAVAFLTIGIPLLLTFGLRGLAAGIVVQTVAHMAVRVHALHRLFAGFRYLRHAVGAVLPALPAVAVVLALRAVESGQRTATLAAAELGLYVLIAAVATWFLERRLLREALSYLGRGELPAAA
jgi:PST family polysaccharide transporter